VLKASMQNLFTREEFSQKVKTQILKDSSICRLCLLPTECGDCAHIVAAGKNGPRNKCQMIKQGLISDAYKINARENGLYLCTNCHRLIDTYPEKYTFQFLANLKYTTVVQEQQDPIRIGSIPEDPIQIGSSDSIPDDSEENMGTNECVHCHRIFARRANLDYHLSRNVCQKKSSKMCPKCKYVFSTKQMLQYHVANAVCGVEKPQQVTPKLTLKSEYDHMSLAELLVKVSKLEREIEVLQSCPQTINNN
jgi:hypothetical protein